MAPDPAVTSQAVVLVQAQAAAREDISKATAAAVALALRMFRGRWGDRDAVARLTKSLAATTRAGQRQTAVSTSAYWSRMVSLVTGRRVPPVRQVDASSVRGVPLEVVFGRLADQYRWLEASRGQGTTPEVRLERAVEAWSRQLERQVLLSVEAPRPVPTSSVLPPLPAVHAPAPVVAQADLTPRELAAVLDRMIAENPIPRDPPDILVPDDILARVVERSGLLVSDTLSATMRDQIMASAARDPRTVTGYRRVIHPELSLSKHSCGLCVAVSTRLFRRDNLLPMHARCNCTVMPVVGAAGGDGDVGGAINDIDLAALYGEAGSTSARDLKRTRYAFEQHTELGTRLVAARPEGKAPRPVAPAPQVNAAVVLRVARETITDLERRAAAGENVTEPLAFQRGLAERMVAALAA